MGCRCHRLGALHGNRSQQAARRPAVPANKATSTGFRRLSDVALDCPASARGDRDGMLYIDPSRRPGGTGEVLARIRAIASGFGLDTSDDRLRSTQPGRSPRRSRRLIEIPRRSALGVDLSWSGLRSLFREIRGGRDDRGRSPILAQHTVLLLRGRSRCRGRRSRGRRRVARGHLPRCDLDPDRCSSARELRAQGPIPGAASSTRPSSSSS